MCLQTWKLKNHTKTHRFVLLTHRPCMWPAFATHLKGSQVRTHAAPDLSEASGKKNPSGKETRETLKEMGFSGDGSSRSEWQNECQNVSQHPMLLMSISAVLILLVLTHICARRILNLELLPQFNWRIPQIAIWARGRQLNLPHLHSEGLNSSQILPTTHAKCIRVLCPQQFALSEDFQVRAECFRLKQDSWKTRAA